MRAPAKVFCVAALGVLLSGVVFAASTPLLSEFLPNQSDRLETEWIELYNPTAYPIDLRFYQIGDGHNLYPISDTGLYLPAGEYIILAQDSKRFLKYYTDFTGLIASPDHWAVLNNDGDSVRLAYLSGDIIDSVSYEAGFPDNRSWERYIAADGRSYWGGSFSPTGSTPGKPNAYFPSRSAELEVTVDPNPFSPDGDGHEDETVIRYNPPEAQSCDLVIYDIGGRKVKTFFEAAPAIPGQVVWDGRGDDGRTLAVGIYIIFARIEGGTSMEIKKTVVIAR